MKDFTQKDIKTLLSNLCCSKCRNDFDIDSIKVIESDKDIMICNLHCLKCDKDFGEIIFNYNKKSRIHTPLEVIEGPLPISTDDVIDAHNFIKNNL